MYEFSKISNLIQLSGLLRTERGVLDMLQNKFYRGTEPLVEIMQIPKKNRRLGFRTVYKIKVKEALNPLKHLKFILNENYINSEYAYGFTKGRNIRNNALKHLNKKTILHIDIKDFFDNITIKDIYNAFVSMGFLDNIAIVLAKMVTLNDKLAQGFPTSPILANIVCIKMDEEIGELCEATQLTYTRYADDLTISGDSVEILDEIEKIIVKFGFELNKFKTKYSYSGQSQYVTGLTVADKFYPRISVKIKRQIRQKLYYMQKYGVLSHIKKTKDITDLDIHDISNICYKELKYIKGWLDFIYSIEPMFTIKYSPIYEDVYISFIYKHK